MIHKLKSKKPNGKIMYTCECGFTGMLSKIEKHITECHPEWIQEELDKRNLSSEYSRIVVLCIINDREDLPKCENCGEYYSDKFICQRYARPKFWTWEHSCGFNLFTLMGRRGGSKGGTISTNNARLNGTGMFASDHSIQIQGGKRTAEIAREQGYPNLQWKPGENTLNGSKDKPHHLYLITVRNNVDSIYSKRGDIALKIGRARYSWTRAVELERMGYEVLGITETIWYPFEAISALESKLHDMFKASRVKMDHRELIYWESETTTLIHSNGSSEYFDCSIFDKVKDIIVSEGYQIEDTFDGYVEFKDSQSYIQKMEVRYHELSNG